MKKARNLIYILGLMLIMLFSVATTVKADPDYDITNVFVKAKVQPDGSLDMERRISYDFDDDANGVYYDQDLDEKQELKNLSIEIIQNGHTYPIAYKNVDDGIKDNNVYKFVTNDPNRFKVFHKTKADDKYTVVYRYKITNAVKNWDDTAELNFKIIGSNWDVQLDHVKIDVIFPGPVKGLKAWAHGPLDGDIQVSPKKGRITMTASDVDQFIEVHSIFPKSVTPLNKNTSEADKRDIIISDESELAAKTNRKRITKLTIGYLLIIASLAMTIFGIVKGLLIKKQGEKLLPKKALKHNFEIPEVNPVMAQTLVNGGKPDSKAVAGYLMYLAGKHKIKITDYMGGKLYKKTYYKITLVDKDLKKDELLRFLFNEIGDGESFTTYDLHHYATSDKLANKFKKWQKKWTSRAVREGYFNSKAVKITSNLMKWAVGLSATSSLVILIAISLVKLNTWQIWGLFGLVVLEFVSLYSADKRASVYTKKGKEVTDKLREFELMLKDIGHFKMRDVGELILWEDIMPYAVVFGLAKKVLHQLKVEFSTDELNGSDFDYARPLYFGSGNTNFANNFNSSFNAGANLSSMSGGSGGFSGGSSGGFGGGSGGGAF